MIAKTKEGKEVNLPIESKATHTPTPLEYKKVKDKNGDFFIIQRTRGTAVGPIEVIAKVFFEDDAAFIVKAVNSHEALLSGGIHLMECPRRNSKSYQPYCNRCETAEEAFRYWRALAEGGK